MTPSPNTNGGSRRATMKQVAEAAGVSVQTVSNLVNDRAGQMAPETRDRVARVIESLGYHPNMRAVSLRSNRSHALGFLILDAEARFLADPMTDMIVAGIADIGRDAGYGLLIQAARPDKPDLALFRPLLEQRVDGAFLLLSGEPRLRRWYAREAAKLGTPFVLFEEPPNRNIASVTAANRHGARQLAKHLIERGHRRIAFIAASVPWPMIEQRFAGYRDALAEAEIAPDPALELFAGGWDPANGALLAERLVSLNPGPTAIMAANDLLASGVLRALRARGLQIPGDVAVTGFDDFEFAAFTHPALSTVRIPAYEMGTAAASWIIKAIEGGQRERLKKVFDVEICVRESS